MRFLLLLLFIVYLIVLSFQKGLKAAYKGCIKFKEAYIQNRTEDTRKTWARG